MEPIKQTTVSTKSNNEASSSSDEEEKEQVGELKDGLLMDKNKGVGKSSNDLKKNFKLFDEIMKKNSSKRLSSNMEVLGGSAPSMKSEEGANKIEKKIPEVAPFSKRLTLNQDSLEKPREGPGMEFADIQSFTPKKEDIEKKFKNLSNNNKGLLKGNTLNPTSNNNKSTGLIGNVKKLFF